MAKKPLKMFKVNNISEVRDVDALYCIKTATDTEFSIVVTDAFGAIVNLKDLQTPAGIQGIASDDGTIEVTGTTFKNIRLSATLVNAINSALKPGDNISDLINDAGYLTSFIEADPIFQASEASNFVSGDKANLDNQSGVNTGDETTLSIQTKRPLKTVDNKSLEGTGNIEIDYNTVINKPTEFPPSTHTHVISDITGLQGELDNKLDENNPSATGTLTLQTDPSILVGTFDILVRNPSSGVVSKVPEATYRKSSVDVPWTEVSGKPTTFTPSAHTHTKSQITDFAHTHPISDVTGLPTALDDLQLNKEDKSNKNIANGYAGLDSSGKINPIQLPALAITDTFVVNSQAAMLALVAEVGDVAVRTDLNKSFILRVTGASTLANWQELLSPTSVDQTIIDGSTNAVSGNAVFNGLTELSDLSNFKETITITQDGLYNAFPSVEKASNGDLLTVYRKGVTHLTFDGSIRIKRSTDNGDTWSPESTIVTGVGHDYRDPSIARLANGNIIMSYFDRITDSNILIYTSISTDNGITFGTPVQLTGYADYGAVSSRVIQLDNGDLLLATYGKSGASGLLNVFKSTNSGTSWSILSTIAAYAFVPNFKYSEPSLLLLPNGNVVASVRNNSDTMVARSVSTDSGVTWSSLVNKFSANSRAGMVYFDGKIITTYRNNAGKGAVRVSKDEGVSWGDEVGVYGTEFGEQDEYSSLVNMKNIYAYVYSKQNSTGSSSNVRIRYFNVPISIGTIPFIQVEGFNSTGSVSVVGSLFTNNILGRSGGDVSISTNTQNTSTNIFLKTGGLDRISILGTGFVGFGKSVPTQVIDVVGNGAFSGFVATPLINAQQVRSNSSSGMLKIVGGATNYGGSIDVISPSFATNNGGINFRTGLVAGESPIVASFNSAGLFNVVGNITATSYSGTATLTGTPTAPTAPAGTNTTQVATTAFVQAAARPYKVYTALLIQTGTNAPTATVLENTLGGTVVWSRTGVGAYVGTFSTSIDINKAVCFISNGITGAAGNYSKIGINSTDVRIYNYILPTLTDLNSDVNIEIRIYN